VRCEQKVSAFTIATVPDAHCVAAATADADGQKNVGEVRTTKPATEQTCYLGDCPARSESTARRRRRRPAIIGEPSEFVMLMDRRRHVTLEVGGGSAILIPDVNVRIYCPVRRRYRDRPVVWRRVVAAEVDEDVVGTRGRVKVTGRGALRIRKSRESDAGVYWCTVGDDRANLTLNFHSLQQALALAEQRRHQHIAELHHSVVNSSGFCLTGQRLLLVKPGPS